MVDDVQKLKSVLMNNHQIALFNYISKPKISIENNDEKEEEDNYLSNLEKVFIFSKNNQNEQLTEEIMKYYGQLRKNGNWSQIDMKLFEFLDEDFKKKLKRSCPNSNKPPK